MGLAVSAYFPVTKFLTTNIYFNVTHDTTRVHLTADILMFRTVFLPKHKAPAEIQKRMEC